jgi:putative endonuclease
MSQKQGGYVYIMFSKKNGTLYTGVTSNLGKRVFEHKNRIIISFTSEYSVDKLGYYEFFDDICDAIRREKQIKGGSRKNKLKLIESLNPDWEDLYNTIN